MPSSPSPLIRRLRFRFSLRTLLIVMVLLGLIAAWVGSVWDRVRQQRAIVRVLNMHGADVFYDYQHEPGGGINQSRLPRGNAVLQATVGNDVFAYVDTIFLHQSDDERAVSKQLELLPNLTKLTSVSAAGLTDAHLKLLARNSRLTGLHLSASRISATGLSHLAAFQELEHLTLRGTEIDDTVLAALPALPKLKSLQLIRTAVTSAGFAPVSKLQGLERLDIFVNRALDDDGLTHLHGLHQLKSLSLLDTSVSDTGLAHLRELKALRHLHLHLCPVGDAGMEHLAGLTDLEDLKLAATQVGDAGLRKLAPLQRLKFLRLGATKITDQGAPVIGQFRELNYLWLTETALTDACLPSLQSLKKLRFLEIGPNISQSSAATLQAHLPNCDIAGHDPAGKNKFQLRAVQQVAP